jgi:transcriptional regulator with XRE-family HTH domain
MEPTKLIRDLAKARHQLGITQTELARKLGLKQAYISEIENGIRDSRLSLIMDLARVLGFELMLVPRNLVPLVDQFKNSRTDEQNSEIPRFRKLLED